MPADKCGFALYEYFRHNPYNYPAKFSHPGVLMEYYLGGNTLIEAYRKSVWEPGLGVFVGETLARPFASPPTKQTD